MKVGDRIGGFKIEEILPAGRGGMSQVVRASRRNDPRSMVALKVARIGQGANDRIYGQAVKDETNILVRLRGVPGVVQVLPVDTTRNLYTQRAIELQGGPWFFAMEYLAGGSLEHRLKAIHRLSVAEAASLAALISRILGERLHAARIVHNDVKPDNILFSQPLRLGQPYAPVLVDFGIAAKLERKLQDAGSILYMAPERFDQAEGLIPPEILQDSVKADVWAVGILLYRMLAGQVPFKGRDEKSTISAIRRNNPIKLRHLSRHIPSTLDAFIVEDCLATDPHNRPSALEVAHTLEQFAKDAPVSKSERSNFWPF